MSTYAEIFAEYTVTQNYVMAGAVLWTALVVVGWYMLPKVVPQGKYMLPARAVYVVGVGLLYVVMVAWFAAALWVAR